MVENHQTPIHLKTGYPAFRPPLKTNRSLEQLMVGSDDSFPFESGPFSRDMCSLGGVTFHAKLHLKSFQGRIPLQSKQFESMS